MRACDLRVRNFSTLIADDKSRLSTPFIARRSSTLFSRVDVAEPAGGYRIPDTGYASTRFRARFSRLAVAGSRVLPLAACLDATSRHRLAEIARGAAKGGLRECGKEMRRVEWSGVEERRLRHARRTDNVLVFASAKGGEKRASRRWKRAKECG